MRETIRDYAVVLAIAFGAYCAPAVAADGYPAKAIRMMTHIPYKGSSPALAAVAAPAAKAQDWSPQRNVEVVVPVPAGGALDLLARSMQQV